MSYWHLCLSLHVEFMYAVKSHLIANIIYIIYKVCVSFSMASQTKYSCILNIKYCGHFYGQDHIYFIYSWQMLENWSKFVEIPIWNMAFNVIKPIKCNLYLGEIYRTWWYLDCLKFGLTWNKWKKFDGYFVLY